MCAITTFGVFTAAIAMSNMPAFEQMDLYTSGSDGYHTYRIPAMVISARNTILAFCEGRKEGISDHGNIHIVLKRSFDNGITWEKMQLVYKEEDTGEKVTIGNPCPVVDSETGVIWLAFTRNNQQVFITKSDDDGASWSEPLEISEHVESQAFSKSLSKKAHPNWDWYGTGPGHGLQLNTGSRKGRLLFPSYHMEKQDGENSMRSHVIYSDDHGETWHVGASTSLSDGIELFKTNRDSTWSGCECLAVQATDGRVYLAIRNQNFRVGRRAYAWSDDGGESWTPMKLDESLLDPACQAIALLP